MTDCVRYEAFSTPIGLLAVCLSSLVACSGGHGTKANDAGSENAHDAASELASHPPRDAAGDVPADAIAAVDSSAADTGTEAGSPCLPSKPDLCGSACVDTQGDPTNCGSCDNHCPFLPNAYAGCAQGKCTLASCTNNHADCTADPGCETQLGTADNCAACGDHACTLANTMLTCQGTDGCTRSVCKPGFANCDQTAPDCETRIAAGGACLPNNLGTLTTAGDILDLGTAIGTDGSYFLAGRFRGTVDFDPTSGQDIQSTSIPLGIGEFITKINADGTYGWTRIFDGAAIDLGGPGGLAGAAGGAVVLMGVYSGFNGAIDLDPGPGVDLHQPASTSDQEGVILKLAADGSFVWGRVFASAGGPLGGIAANSNLGGIAVDAADSVYVGGLFRSAIDFDPGPGTAIRSSSQTQAAMLVKLTSGGDFVWVQPIDDGPCAARLQGVAVASDGEIWAEGVAGTGGNCTLGSPSAPSIAYSSIVATFGSGGDARGVHILAGGTESVLAETIAPGADGSVYVGGRALGPVDFGAGAAVRPIGPSFSSNGFVVKLASDASVVWVDSVSDGEVVSLAATPDGGVLGSAWAGTLVARIGPDGTPRWTLAESNEGSTVVASRGSSFAIAGFTSTLNLSLSRFNF